MSAIPDKDETEMGKGAAEAKDIVRRNWFLLVRNWFLLLCRRNQEVKLFGSLEILHQTETEGVQPISKLTHVGSLPKRKF